MSAIGSSNPIGGAFVSAAAYSYAIFRAKDLNGDGRIDKNEILANGVLIGHGGFDPANPTAVQAFNKINPNLVAPKTHEVVGGVEHELMPNLAFGADFTYRRYNDVFWQPLAGVRSGDYVLDHMLTGNMAPIGSFSVPVYALKASKEPAA